MRPEKEQTMEAAKHEDLIAVKVLWAKLGPPQNVCVEALNPGHQNVTVFGQRAGKEWI